MENLAVYLEISTQLRHQLTVARSLELAQRANKDAGLVRLAEASE